MFSTESGRSAGLYSWMSKSIRPNQTTSFEGIVDKRFKKQDRSALLHRF